MGTTKKRHERRFFTGCLAGGCQSNSQLQAALNLGLQNRFSVYTPKVTPGRIMLEGCGEIVTAHLTARHASCNKPKAQAAPDYEFDQRVAW